MKSFRIKVTGKVQGVGYRQGAKATAVALSLKGWVKNLADGSVQINVSGELEPILDLVKWCQQGTYNALVKDVHITEIPVEDRELKTFDIH